MPEASKKERRVRELIQLVVWKLIRLVLDEADALRKERRQEIRLQQAEDEAALSLAFARVSAERSGFPADWADLLRDHGYSDLVFIDALRNANRPERRV